MMNRAIDRMINVIDKQKNMINRTIRQNDKRDKTK